MIIVLCFGSRLFSEEEYKESKHIIVDQIKSLMCLWSSDCPEQNTCTFGHLNINFILIETGCLESLKIFLRFLNVIQIVNHPKKFKSHLLYFNYSISFTPMQKSARSRHLIISNESETAKQKKII